jgi:hypothetical protein
MDKHVSTPYEPPKVVVLGSVAELTQSLASGANLDLADFTPSV